MRDPDPEDPLQLARLRSAADASLAKLQPACKWRLEMLRRFVGPYYPGEDGAEREKRPCNLIELGVDIFQRGLASHQPQAIVQTDFEELLPTATDFETVLNRRLHKMKFKDALNVCAVEALFTIGVMCVGVAIDDEYDAGCSFADPVLFPDLILDLNAKSWTEQAYVGHEFLVPLEWVADNSDFNIRPKEQFVKYCASQFGNNERDWQRTQQDDYQDLVRLRQLYLPRQNKIVLMACEGHVKEALSVSDWEGPENITGPYYDLSFRKVPGNVLPLAPVANWRDLDEIANLNYSKAFRQAARCKTVGIAQDQQTAEAVKEEGDGGIVWGTPDGLKEVTFGGANKNVVDAAVLAQNLLDKLGGNWSLLGGLAPSSATVGQDKLLAEGAGGRMKDMQDTMTEFETDVVGAIGFWEWQKPVGEEKFTKRLEGTSFGLSDQVWSPESRKGEFFQLNLAVNPYKRINRSPSEQAAFLTQFLEQVIIPSIPAMQAGDFIDWEMYYKMQARYNNAPEINMFLNYPNGESMPSAMPEAPKMPSTSHRKYERINTQGGARDPLQEAMSNFSASAEQNGQPMQPAMS
jgi:hypothetical protein